MNLCDEKIGQYIHTNGGEGIIWLYSMKSTSYIPGTVRFEVLKNVQKEDVNYVVSLLVKTS